MHGETASVQAYERIAREATDPVVAPVMELLVEDGECHHVLLQCIATSLSIVEVGPEFICTAARHRTVRHARRTTPTIRTVHGLELRSGAGRANCATWRAASAGRRRACRAGCCKYGYGQRRARAKPRLCCRAVGHPALDTLTRHSPIVTRIVILPAQCGCERNNRETTIENRHTSAAGCPA